MSALERRIRAVERAVAVRQPATRPTKMMAFPVGGDDEDIARHQAEVEQALADGFFVIRLVPLEPREAMR
jgi:hypothetical protein